MTAPRPALPHSETPPAPAGRVVSQGYTEAYDEAYDDSAGHAIRPAYAALLDRLAGQDLDVLTRRVNELLAAREVRFGAEDGHPFRVDPVPRILTEAEWRSLSAGVRQRVRTLDALLVDVYGERRAVAAGVLPERVVAAAGYLEDDLVGHQPASGWLGIAGLDVVRDRQGRFRVLEDNARTASGLAYAAAASAAVAEVLGVEPSRKDQAGHRPAPDEPDEEVGRALRSVLEAAAPDLDGELVLLSDGPGNSAWFEHQWLAAAAGLVLAQPAELRRRRGRVELADGRPVRTVYRRTSEDRVRTPSGELTGVAELLLEPLRARTIGVVNLFGTGAADDKSVYAYVDDLTRFYLGEEPLLPSVPTYDLLDADRRAEVLDRLEELVVKPRDGSGGEGVTIGPRATVAELAAARRAVAAEPERWIAQEVVLLSTHPTVVGGRLAPRHVDLRPFAFHDGTEVVVPVGGLTRVALKAGSMVVNSSQEGGGKATWVAG